MSEPSLSEQGVVRLATSAMGCRFELVLAGGPEPWLRAAGEEAIEEIEQAHRSLTRFERGSVVHRVNEGATEPLDEELFELFALCERVREASAGAFDIRRGGTGQLVLDCGARTLAASDGATVDLGGVAKGYAIDQAVAVLQQAGITSAFIHGGSSSTAGIGFAPGGEPWRVLVEHPAGHEPVLVDVSDRCLAISGDQQQAGHLIDPRTGSPCPAGSLAACVGASAAACDAWATALVVLGARPKALTHELGSILPSTQGWLTEPSSFVLRSTKPCQTSTAVRS